MDLSFVLKSIEGNDNSLYEKVQLEALNVSVVWSFFLVILIDNLKYPRIFTYVSTDIYSRIHGYFIKYPRLRKFFCTENLFFGQILCAFRE